MRAGKGVDRRQRIGDSRKSRKRRCVDIEEPRPARWASNTNVSQCDRVAVAIAAGAWASQMLFKSGEGSGVPMLTPFCARRLIQLEFVLQIFTHPRHDQWVRIAGNDLRQSAYA